MSRNSYPLLSVSMPATGVIVANRFVTPAGAQAGAGVNAQGVAKTDAAIGDELGVTVLGTEVVEAGAAIAAGSLVECDATGRAILHAAGVILGRLAPGESAAAAGEFVEVILFPN